MKIMCKTYYILQTKQRRFPSSKNNEVPALFRTSIKGKIKVSEPGIGQVQTDTQHASQNKRNVQQDVNSSIYMVKFTIAIFYIKPFKYIITKQLNVKDSTSES